MEVLLSTSEKEVRKVYNWWSVYLTYLHGKVEEESSKYRPKYFEICSYICDEPCARRISEFVNDRFGIQSEPLPPKADEWYPDNKYRSAWSVKIPFEAPFAALWWTLEGTRAFLRAGMSDDEVVNRVSRNYEVRLRGAIWRMYKRSADMSAEIEETMEMFAPLDLLSAYITLGKEKVEPGPGHFFSTTFVREDKIVEIKEWKRVDVWYCFSELLEKHQPDWVILQSPAGERRTVEAVCSFVRDRFKLSSDDFHIIRTFGTSWGVKMCSNLVNQDGLQIPADLPGWWTMMGLYADIFPDLSPREIIYRISDREPHGRDVIFSLVGRPTDTEEDFIREGNVGNLPIRVQAFRKEGCFEETDEYD